MSKAHFEGYNDVPKSVVKRQATQDELKDIRVLVKHVNKRCFNEWEHGFIESMEKKLIDAEEFSSSAPCLMLSDKQFQTVDKLVTKLGNQQLDQGQEYLDE
jgi:hypothetical protein